MIELDLLTLKREAATFIQTISHKPLPTLFGVNDGKTVGTLIEQTFRTALKERGYTFAEGNSASGIDFPSLGVDLKVTSIQQPQSSCPFRSAEQKVYGLGYHLMIFVYRKTDHPLEKYTTLEFVHAVFIDRERTADYQLTSLLIRELNNGANSEEIAALLADRNLPLDDDQRYRLAERILQSPPNIGYLTISNALQWRLQYQRAIDTAEKAGVAGVESILSL